MLNWSEPLQYVALAGAGIGYFVIAHLIDRRWAAFQRDTGAEEFGATTGPAASGASSVATAAHAQQPEPVAVGKFEQQPVRIGKTRGALVRTAASSRMHGGAESSSRRFDEPAYQQETEGAVK
jgi:hypothetical protein